MQVFVNNGKDVGVGSFFFPYVIRIGLIHLSGLWLHAVKHSMWRARDAERIGQNIVLEPVSYFLMMI